MSQWAAITVLGKDRPGIVAGVTRALYEHGCNLEDSSATRLRDAFAMILVAKLPEPPKMDELQATLDRHAAELGVVIDLRDLGSLPPAPPPEGQKYVLSVYGADQPGIVYRVSDTLAGCQCNIEDVTTRVAGTSDRPVYILMLEMSVPGGDAEHELQTRLAALRAELPVDISLRPVEEETL